MARRGGLAAGWAGGIRRRLRLGDDDEAEDEAEAHGALAGPRACAAHARAALLERRALRRARAPALQLHAVSLRRSPLELARDPGPPQPPPPLVRPAGMLPRRALHLDSDDDLLDDDDDRDGDRDRELDAGGPHLARPAHDGLRRPAAPRPIDLDDHLDTFASDDSASCSTAYSPTQPCIVFADEDAPAPSPARWRPHHDGLDALPHRGLPPSPPAAASQSQSDASSVWLSSQSQSQPFPDLDDMDEADDNDNDEDAYFADVADKHPGPRPLAQRAPPSRRWPRGAENRPAHANRRPPRLAIPKRRVADAPLAARACDPLLSRERVLRLRGRALRLAMPAQGAPGP